MSLSLATLEVFVHMDASEEPAKMISIAATLPDDGEAIERIAAADLPADWRAIGNLKLRALGASWITRARSLALMVPSAVIEGEWNVLINPLHERFSEVRVDAPVPFRFDHRMFERRG